MEWGFNPGSYSELRPGCFDVNERVRAVNANGVPASMNFPTTAGWNARTFAEGDNKDLRTCVSRSEWKLQNETAGIGMF